MPFESSYPQPVNTSDHTPEGLLGPLNDVEHEHAPATLHLAGDRSLLERGTRVAIVGSRNASPQGLTRATLFARALAERGITVVSGLAEGIDTAAHTAAINAGGRTIAVLGTPLERCYPASNRALQDTIMRDHLAVSQFAAGTSTNRSHFPMRNRTMALLSDATVIVEAGAKSGTEHQGWEALRLGRLLFLMQSLAERTELAWAQKLLEYGAQVLSRENLPDVIANLPQRECGDAVTF